MTNPVRERRRGGLFLAFAVLLGVACRLPGLLWGLNLSAEHEYLLYHPDELNLATSAKEFWSGVSNERLAYPKGFPFQLAVASKLAGARHENDAARIVLAGRVLSLAYGAATIAVVFYLSLAMGGSVAVAGWAALLLSLCGAHVTQSHFATADVSVIFWIYATMLASWEYSRAGGTRRLALAAVCCGMALAVKFAWIACIPLVIVVFQGPRRRQAGALACAVTALTFYVGNGGHFGIHNFIALARNVLHDNVQGAASHNDWLNVPVYLCQMVPGLGLTSFVLMTLGGLQFAARTASSSFASALNDRRVTLCVFPLAAHFVSVCFLDIPFCRHILPLFPALCMAAGGAASKLVRPGRGHVAFLSLVALYQLVCVLGVEYYFVHDTRDDAKTWMNAHVAQGARVYYGRYLDPAAWSDTYTPTSLEDADYLVLHETLYFRYVRSILNPQARFARADQLFHGTAEELDLIRALFSGESGYRLAHSSPVRPVTPEMMAFKKVFGTFTLYTGDTLVFEKRAR